MTYLSHLLKLILVAPTIVILTTSVLLRSGRDFDFIFAGGWRGKGGEGKFILSLWFYSLRVIYGRWCGKIEAWKAGRVKWKCWKLLLKSFEKFALLLCIRFRIFRWRRLLEIFLWWWLLIVLDAVFVIILRVWWRVWLERGENIFNFFMCKILLFYERWKTLWHNKKYYVCVCAFLLLCGTRMLYQRHNGIMIWKKGLGFILLSL